MSILKKGEGMFSLRFKGGVESPYTPLLFSTGLRLHAAGTYISLVAMAVQTIARKRTEAMMDFICNRLGSKQRFFMLKIDLFLYRVLSST